MHKFIVMALMIAMSSSAQAQIKEKPIKLENQGTPGGPAAPEVADHITFPAATEPYKPEPFNAPAPVAQPMEAVPIAQPRPQPRPQPQQAVAQPYQQPAQDQFARAEFAAKSTQTYQQPLASQTITTQSAFSDVPVSTSSNNGFANGRDAVERAAESCDGELAQLWQNKTNIAAAQRGQFQKCMGEAKYRCDELKKAAQLFKKTDADLSTYQFNMQQARDSAR
jgi:hypothetical protein